MLLDWEKTKKLLSKYSIPFANTEIVKTQSGALGFAKKNGYPIVLKIFSPNILHRTDIGGVIVDIKDEKSLNDAWKKINQLAKAKKAQILIQKMEEGEQIIAGAKIDPVFGPIILFGLGGILVEALGDVSFRLAPIAKKEVSTMIKEIRGYKILAGFRGKRAVNLTKIEKILFSLSELITNEPKIKEIDLNPIIVSSKQAVVVDVKIVI